jgi:DNA-nicking Smr family endonuclease
MDEQDKQLFREAVQDVRPLKQKHRRVVLTSSGKQKSSPTHAKYRQQLMRRHHLNHESEVMERPEDFPPWQLTEPTQLLQANESIFHAKPGVQPRTLKQLKRGTYPMGAELDLHGRTRKQADAALHNLITHAQQQRIRGLRLIPGKGQRTSNYALMKSHLCHWLTQDERILAFCTATPSDGGGGALYVLLRKG